MTVPEIAEELNGILAMEEGHERNRAAIVLHEKMRVLAKTNLSEPDRADLHALGDEMLRSVFHFDPKADA